MADARTPRLGVISTRGSVIPDHAELFPVENRRRAGVDAQTARRINRARR